MAPKEVLNECGIVVVVFVVFIVVVVVFVFVGVVVVFVSVVVVFVVVVIVVALEYRPFPTRASGATVPLASTWFIQKFMRRFGFLVPLGSLHPPTPLPLIPKADRSRRQVRPPVTTPLLGHSVTRRRADGRKRGDLEVADFLLLRL